MRDFDITDPMFHDEEQARLFFEGERWPTGVTCPFCGGFDDVRALDKTGAMGAGWYYCNACDQKKFTVRTASIMERSHIPLAKWALGFRLMAASKKGVSAKQLERMLGLGYRAAWFMAMRLREAMRYDGATPIGGEGKTLESDETFVGGKKKNVHKGKPEPKKHAVHALVEPGGHLRATHVPDVSAKTLRTVLEKHADKRSALHTDDGLANLSLGKDFAEHKTVNHSQDEYYKDGAGVQSAESYFALLKRGIMGSFHSVSEQHLGRYCDEFAFRWNTRSALGIEDAERARLMVKAAAGKRLTYKISDR